MKKNYLIILTAFLAFVCASQAQVFTPFKSKEGISTATIQANNSGFPSPELVAVGAMTGQAPNVPISLFFDASNGTSNAWVYIFRSAINHDTLIGFVVTQLPIVGYQALPLDPSSITGNLPFKLNASLEGRTWIESDVMAQKLRNNTVYIAYVYEHPTAEVKYVSLVVNTDNPVLEKNKPYWLLYIQGETNIPLTCQVQGETGNVTCQSITAVADGQPASQEIRAYPTPATDILYVNIPSSVQSLNSELELRDAFGNRVKELVAPQNGEAEIVTISTSGLASGLYFVRYVNNSGAVTIPVIVNK